MNQIADRSIAVVKMRLPYTDRRSLSQAWRSALGLADGGPPHADHVAARSAKSTAACSSFPIPARDAAPVGVPETRVGAARVLPRRANGAGDDVTLRRPRTSDPRAVRRPSFAAARSYPPFCTSLTLAVDGGRVQLVLRRERETLHIVAICAPANADLVRRALVCAQAHLRARGEVLQADVRESEALA